ncbi:MAG: VanZ family protein, partial [Gemmatimonadaceae bacterium]
QVLSFVVEGTQVFSPSRTASILDLATNTFGAFLGAVIVAFLIVDLARAKGQRSYLGVPAFVLAAAYVVAVICEVVTPLFAIDMDTAMGAGPVTWLRIALHASMPLAWSQIPVADVFMFAPGGFLVVMMLAERGAGAAWRRVAVIGSLLLLAGDFGHGFMRLPVRWEAIAVHIVAWCFGAWAAHRWLAPLSRELRGAERALAALAAYAGILAVWGWRPFLPETRGDVILQQLTLDHFVPLQALSQRMDVFSALHVVQQFFLYFPLGCLLAVWPLRLRGRWSHLWAGVWLAAIIEAGHILVEGRFFDITNWIIACAGLGMGWLLVRRVGYKPYGAAMSAAERTP